MSGFLPLLKVHFIASVSGMGLNTPNKKAKASATASLLMLIGILLFVASTTCLSIFQVAGQSKAYDLAFCYMISIFFMFALLFSCISSQSVVFGNKDLDILFSLPVNQFSILLSKMLALYLENLLISACMLLPTSIFYLSYTAFSFLKIILILIVIIILPLYTTIISVLVSFLTSLMQAKLKKGKAVNTILTFSSLLIVAVGMFALQNSMQILMLNPDEGLQILYKYVLPLKLLGNGIFNLNMVSFLIFVAISVIPFLLLVWVLSLCYHKLVTSILVVKTFKKKLELENNKTKSSLVAFVEKELNKFFGVPIFVFNAGFGIIMMICITIASFIFNDKLAQIFVPLAELGLDLNIAKMGIIVASLSFMGSTCYFTAVASSLEGKTLWLIKSLPISAKKIFGAQIITNCLITMVPELVCSILLCISLNLAVSYWVFAIILSVICAIPNSICGVFINLAFPKTNALNDIVIVKQSTSALLGMFTNFAITIVPTMVIFNAVTTSNYIIVSAIIIAIYLSVSFILWKRLTKICEKKLYNLN